MNARSQVEVELSIRSSSVSSGLVEEGCLRVVIALIGLSAFHAVIKARMVTPNWGALGRSRNYGSPEHIVSPVVKARNEAGIVTYEPTKGPSILRSDNNKIDNLIKRLALPSPEKEGSIWRLSIGGAPWRYSEELRTPYARLIA